MRVGYLQTSPVFGEKDTNFREVEKHLEGVRADLIVLPELFATGYTFASHSEVEMLAEEVEGETSQFLVQIAQRIDGAVVAGFAERESGRYFNSSLMVNGDGIVGSYRKIHLFNREKQWFSPGNKPFEVHDVKDTKVGIMICFDWIFPEAARTLALRGAEVIAHPVNLVLPYCQEAMKTRCIENRIYAVTANRIGREKRGVDDFTFTGASQITSTRGKVLSSAPKDSVHRDTVEIDVSEAREKNINPFNHLLTDRRPEFYD